MGHTTSIPRHIPSFLECDLLQHHYLAHILPKRGWKFTPVRVHPIYQPTSQRKEILRDEDTSIIGVYKTIWSIVKLGRMFSDTVNTPLASDR
jgi:hypothetical protein